MYKLITAKGDVFTLGEKSLKAFALYEALQRGITRGNIHDNQTAIEYLESIGIKVKNENESEVV